MQALQGWQQAQTAKAQMQAYDTGQAHMALTLQQAANLKAQNDQAATQATATQNFPPLVQQAQLGNAYDQMAQGKGPVRNQPLSPDQWTGAAVQAGFNPENLDRMAQIGRLNAVAGLDAAKAQAAGAGGRSAQPPSIVTMHDEDGNKYHAMFDPTTGKTDLIPQTAATDIPPQPATEPPKGFVWKWDGKHWAQARYTPTGAEALAGALDGADTGTGAGAPAMRFRKNASTGKIEQY